MGFNPLRRSLRFRLCTTTARDDGEQDVGQEIGRDFVNWGTIRIWAAILLLLDAAFGLWNHERFEKSAPKINIAKIALVEALVALLLVGLNFC